MTALSDQFVILDKLRQTAGIAPDAWCRKANVIWLRYLQFKAGLKTPTQSEIDALERALHSLPSIRTADDAISPRHPAASFSPSPRAARPELLSSSGRGR